MIEMINGKAYVKKGDKVYEVGGGGSNFIFANSKEELPDPSTVPENTVGLVPSEGAGGLHVVELTTVMPMPDPTVANSTTIELTDEESSQLTAAASTGMCAVIKMRTTADAGEPQPIVGVCYLVLYSAFMFLIKNLSYVFMPTEDGKWVAQITIE